MGAVQVKYAFSKEKDQSHGAAYVADRMMENKDDFVEMWRAGARVYICGSRAFVESLYEAVLRISDEGERYNR